MNSRGLRLRFHASHSLRSGLPGHRRRLWAMFAHALPHVEAQPLGRRDPATWPILDLGSSNEGVALVIVPQDASLILPSNGGAEFPVKRRQIAELEVAALRVAFAEANEFL